MLKECWQNYKIWTQRHVWNTVWRGESHDMHHLWPRKGNLQSQHCMDCFGLKLSIYGEIQRKWSIDIYHLSLCNTMVIGVPSFCNLMSANSCLVKLHHNFLALKNFYYRSSSMFNHCFLSRETLPCIEIYWNIFLVWTF